MMMLLADLQVSPYVSNKVFLPKNQSIHVFYCISTSWMDFAAIQQYINTGTIMPVHNSSKYNITRKAFRVCKTLQGYVT